jgi:uncharacterized membrane protein
MTDGSSISVFVPVLVLVIVEISQAAREFDLREIAHTKQEPFFYSLFYLLDQSSQDRIRIPQLGPFNFIHGMNLGVLFLGYSLTITTSQGSMRIITGVIVWLFWVLFPILEVNEYVEIMENPEVGPVSFLYHSVVTTIAAGIIYFFAVVLDIISQTDTNLQLFVSFVLLTIFLYYVDLLGFLNLLERELEAT